MGLNVYLHIQGTKRATKIHCITEKGKTAINQWDNDSW